MQQSNCPHALLSHWHSFQVLLMMSNLYSDNTDSKLLLISRSRLVSCALCRPPGRAGDGAAADFSAESAEWAPEGETGGGEWLSQPEEGENGAAGAAAAAQDAAGGSPRGEPDSPSRWGLDAVPELLPGVWENCTLLASFSWENSRRRNFCLFARKFWCWKWAMIGVTHCNVMHSEYLILNANRSYLSVVTESEFWMHFSCCCGLYRLFVGLLTSLPERNGGWMWMEIRVHREQR